MGDHTKVPDEAAIRIFREFDDRNDVRCRIDQSDTLLHPLSRKIGIRRVEALAEFALQAISGKESVQGEFEV
jgi:hypothetical protein